MRPELVRGEYSPWTRFTIDTLAGHAPLAERTIPYLRWRSGLEITLWLAALLTQEACHTSLTAHSNAGRRSRQRPAFRLESGLQLLDCALESPEGSLHRLLDFVQHSKQRRLQL